MASTNQFEVFGVDVRDYGHLWLASWRDLLFGDDSPVRTALDSQVRLRHSDGTSVTYQAGVPVAETQAVHEALAIPEELVLSRSLTLPSIAEADLEAALQLEVSACSPFAPDDTAAGWRVSRGDDLATLTVDLVIASRSAVMGFLGEHFNVLTPGAAEVWAKSGDHWVCIRGFGESRRERHYLQRVIRTGALILGGFLLILALAGVSVLFSERQLANAEMLRDQALQEAKNAIALRDQLAETNTVITELNKLGRQYPNPQTEILRLTELLPDSAFLTQYTQEGREIRVRGRGTEAASLQQALTQQAAFKSVTAPQAISRVGTTGLEQFFLDIELKPRR